MTKNPTGGLEKSLPSSWYLEEHVYALERQHIFLKEWLCVGREEDIPRTGDHRVLDLFGESILLTRNERGQIKAFYNVCRHRGAQLCPGSDQEDSQDRLPLRGGLVGGRNIMCPYHAWTYNLDGQLLRAPHMSEEMGFKVDDITLYGVASECWGGFIFINLTLGDPPSFAEGIAAAEASFERYPLADLAVGHRVQYEVQANWKILCENYNECYHCGSVHPELCQIVPAFREVGGANLDWERGIPHREGAVTFTATGTTSRTMFPGLDADEQVRHKGDLIYPNLFLSLASDHVVAFLLHPREPGLTVIDCLFLFEKHEIEKFDFDCSDAVDFWHLVNRQDWSICERVQKGIGARVHRHGYYSPMEDWNLDIRRYVGDRIGQYLKN